MLLAAAGAAPEDPERDEKQEFGFRWFVPELARHRGIWRDVLLASAALQIVGLATPLFTQVVIDKVVVHQTQSTLIAIAAGLGIFLVFNAAMSWMRQYLVLHTGNRVDAVLATPGVRPSLPPAAAVLRASPDRHHGGAAAGRRDDPRVHHRRGDHASCSTCRSWC